MTNSYKNKLAGLLIFLVGVAFNTVSFADSEKIVNGGFDLPLNQATDWNTIQGVDRVCDWNYYVSAYCAVDMNNTGSNAAGKISQTFVTVPGGTYTLSYSLGANAQCGNGTKTLSVSINGSAITNSAEVIGGARPPFVSASSTFIANGAETTLTFTGDNTGSCGPMIDSVSVFGPDPIVDSDDDGVSDEADSCDNTTEGAVVDSTGCSIAQLCPCDAFNNHGGYVSCTSRAVDAFVTGGLLSDEEGDEIVSTAAHSCRKKGNNGKGR